VARAPQVTNVPPPQLQYQDYPQVTNVCNV
jgi:hypothetical protein